MNETPKREVKCPNCLRWIKPDKKLDTPKIQFAQCPLCGMTFIFSPTDQVKFTEDNSGKTM